MICVLRCPQIWMAHRCSVVLVPQRLFEEEEEEEEKERPILKIQAVSLWNLPKSLVFEISRFVQLTISWPTLLGNLWWLQRCREQLFLLMMISFCSLEISMVVVAVADEMALELDPKQSRLYHPQRLSLKRFVFVMMTMMSFSVTKLFSRCCVWAFSQILCWEQKQWL